ncbi:hypothetical protein [Thiomonas sp.]
MPKVYTHHLKARAPYDRTAVIARAKLAPKLRLVSTAEVALDALFEVGNASDIPALRAAITALSSGQGSVERLDSEAVDTALNLAVDQGIAEKAPKHEPGHARYAEEQERYAKAIRNRVTTLEGARDVYDQIQAGAPGLPRGAGIPSGITIRCNSPQVLVPRPDAESGYLAVTPVEPIGLLFEIMDRVQVGFPASAAKDVGKPKLALSRTTKFLAMAAKQMIVTQYGVHRVLLNEPPKALSDSEAYIHQLAQTGEAQDRARHLRKRLPPALARLCQQAFTDFERQRIAEKKAQPTNGKTKKAKATETPSWGSETTEDHASKAGNLRQFRHEYQIQTVRHLIEYFHEDYRQAGRTGEELAMDCAMTVYDDLEWRRAHSKTAKKFEFLVKLPTVRYWATKALEIF